MERVQRVQKVAVALFFVILMFIGLNTIRDFTGSYDELVQQTQLKVNLREYAVLLEKIGIHWDTALRMNVPRINEFVNRDYGMAALYVCAPFLSQALDSQALMSHLWGVVTWLWFMLGVWSLYSIVRLLDVSRLFSCISALMFYLCPRLFAHAHFNDKDIVFLSLVLLCLWQGGRFLQQMSLRRGVIFSLTGALAFNLRAIGLLPWGVVGLCAVWKLTVQRKWNLKNVVLAMGVIASFLCCYVVMTPATWQNPLGFFDYLFSNAADFSRWSGRMFFRSASFDIPENTLPFYYIFYMIMTTTPLYMLFLALIGQMEAAWASQKRYERNAERTALLIATSLCWILPMAAYVVIRPVVYNGWRHFYFSFAGLAVLAGYGAYCLWKKCTKRRWMKWSYLSLLLLCVIFTAAGMVKNHPYQSSYYNALAGSHLMETDYWNTGGTDALRRLMACEERDETLALEVGCWFFDIQNARFKLSDEEKAVLTTTTEPNAPYLYYIENYVQIYEVPPPEGYHVLFEIESYGRLIGTMYERD